MVFAHAGGASWDEALFVTVPLALLGILLWRAKVRAEREAATRHDVDTPE